MKLVILESPYASPSTITRAANIAYARRCMRHSLFMGEAPIASHLLYTQPGILDDLDPEERALGIAAGLSWRPVAQASVFYVDKGWSPGMKAAWKTRHSIQECRIRSLYGNPTEEPTDDQT